MGGVVRFAGRWAAALGAVGCAAVALAGQAGRWWPLLDIFNHFAPFGLLLTALCALMAACLWRGRARTMVLALAGAVFLLTAPQVVPEWIARLAPRPPAQGERLKLIQFNAYVFNASPARSVDWLIAQRADVVVIEEADGLGPAERRRLRTAYPYCSGCMPWGDTSNLILSKRRPVATARFEDLEGLSAAQGGWSRFAGPGGEYTVIGVHLAWPWLPGSAAQRAALVRFVTSQPKERLILAGDFNMTPWSHGLRRLDDAMGLTRLTHGQLSWPAARYHRAPKLSALPMPYVAIDQVYAGDGWRPVSVGRGPRIGSDHYPIVVELAARPERPRP